MTISNKLMLNGALMALLGAGTMALTATPASAYVVCNRDGDCWHTESRAAYPGVTFNYHPDDWYFHRNWDHDDHYHWRDYHEGRGYYRGGVWVTL